VVLPLLAVAVVVVKTCSTLLDDENATRGDNDDLKGDDTEDADDTETGCRKECDPSVFEEKANKPTKMEEWNFITFTFLLRCCRATFV